jgi:hypothetical protein
MELREHDPQAKLKEIMRRMDVRRRLLGTLELLVKPIAFSRLGGKPLFEPCKQ